MEHDERSRAAIGALEAQRDKLIVWFRKPPEEREANVEKVRQTISGRGRRTSHDGGSRAPHHS